MIPVRSVQIVLQGIRAAGMDPLQALAAVGLDPARLDEPDDRICADLVSALWREAVALTGDRALGIHLAQTIQPGMFDVLDYAVRSCATFGDGARLYQRYVRLLHTGTVLHLDVGDDRVEMTHATEGSAIAIAWVEFVLASWVVIGRQTTGENWTPIEVKFAHARPKSTAAHLELFRSPLRFSAGVNAVAVPREVFDLPQVAADVGLCAVLERHARELSRDLPTTGTSADQVRHIIGETIGRGSVSVDAVAARLHMSGRTLGRRLREEGTSYQRLLTDVRRELAIRHLRERQLSIDEVAVLLGFSMSACSIAHSSAGPARRPASFETGEGQPGGRPASRTLRPRTRCFLG